MSDVSNGPGWWVASDGKWYAPEDHPDPRYVDTFADREQSFQDGPPTSAASGLGFAHRATETITLPDTPPVTERIDVVATPVFQQLPTTPPSATQPTPPTAWRGSFDGPRPDIDRGSNRLVAVVVFLMGIAMIVGSFAPWVTFGGSHVGSQSGWDRTDGIVTIVAGVVLTAAAGVMFVGTRSLILKLTLLLAGTVGFVVFLVDLIDIDAESEAAIERFPGLEVDTGWGIWLVGAASLVAVVAAIVERSRWSFDQSNQP
jgi:hypothetical protein